MSYKFHALVTLPMSICQPPDNEEADSFHCSVALINDPFSKSYSYRTYIWYLWMLYGKKLQPPLRYYSIYIYWEQLNLQGIKV